MVKYLLASHGEFSRGTLSFLNVLMGVNDNVFILEAFLDEESLQTKMKRVFDSIGKFDQLIIFCDLHGGSVAQEVFIETFDDPRNIQIIAGYNVSLVMDIMMRNEVMTNDEIQVAVNESKNSIVYLNNIQQTNLGDDLF